MGTGTKRRTRVLRTPVENRDSEAHRGGEFFENLPEAVHHEELNEFIRYQDDVLDRNIREIEGIIDGQEEQIRRRMELQGTRIQDLYLKDDGLDGLDVRIRQRIETIDRAMAMRTGVMDRRTNEYMEDLYRRNSEWSNRLDLLKQDLAEGSREKNVRHWDERQEQKRINREYGMAPGTQSTTDPRTSHAGAEHDIHPGRNWQDTSAGQPPGAHWTMPETREPETAHGEGRHREGAAGAVPERGPGMQRGPVNRPVARKAGGDMKSPVKMRRKDGGKGGGKDGGTRTPGREPETQRTHTDPGAKDEGLEPASPYPCKNCGKPLAYYDNFARWWCHSCKTWM